MLGQEVIFDIDSNPKEPVSVSTSDKTGRIKSKIWGVKKWSRVLQVILWKIRYFFIRMDAFKKGQKKEFDIST